MNNEIPLNVLTKLFKHFDRLVKLNEDERDLFASALTYQKLKKNKHLKREFEISNDLYFVVSGVLRTYIVGDKDSEHTAQFVIENQWVGDSESYIYQRPTKLKIQALTETEVLVLPYNKRDEFINSIPSILKYHNINMEQNYISLRSRMLDNLSMAAEDKYRTFCEKNPNLVYAVSQKHIASYLGITPEFFSAMKRKIKK